MKRVVIRPRIQVPLLVVIFAVWTLLGVTYFTNGHVVAERDWFGIALGFICVIMGVTGIWRTIRLGIVIDGTGIRMRHLDSRDHVIPWSDVQSVECAQIDARAGLPLYYPVLHNSATAPALSPFGRSAPTRSRVPNAGWKPYVTSLSAVQTPERAFSSAKQRARTQPPRPRSVTTGPTTSTHGGMSGR